MKKILVIGSSGAGKSTFAKRLQVKLRLPLIHLDQKYWKPGWVRPNTLEWERTVRELLQGESWIIEGNYRSTFHLRFPAADTIIWLDFPRLVCLYRIFKRRVKKNREDDIIGCSERVGLDLVYWVLWKYPLVGRRRTWHTLQELNARKKLIILRNRKEVETFLKV